MGSIPLSGRYPEGETATHSSILAWGIRMDRGAWWATVHRVTKSQARLKHLSIHAHIHEHGKRFEKCLIKLVRDFPSGPVAKNLPCSAGDMGSIPDQGTNIPQ